MASWVSRRCLYDFPFFRNFPAWFDMTFNKWFVRSPTPYSINVIGVVSGWFIKIGSLEARAFPLLVEIILTATLLGR